jgi:hypothetical protein
MKFDCMGSKWKVQDARSPEIMTSTWRSAKGFGEMLPALGRFETAALCSRQYGFWQAKATDLKANVDFVMVRKNGLAGIGISSGLVHWPAIWGTRQGVELQYVRRAVKFVEQSPRVSVDVSEQVGEGMQAMRGYAHD